VSACPEGAIEIEIVNIAQWRNEYAVSANAPGLPSADDSISSTRITLPKNLPPDTKRADFYRVKPEHAHWPLILMTVLTQLSVGTFTTVWLQQLFGTTTRLSTAAVGSLLVAGVALGASTMHLGRPIHAYRALKMWKRSWLSREVLMFSLFSGIAGMYAGLVLFGLPGSQAVGALTAVLGIGGVTASACIYLVRARPAWNSRYSVAEFYLTGALLGPLLAASIGVGSRRWLLVATVGASIAQLLNATARFFWMSASDQFELQASAKLLSTRFASKVLVRGALLVLGGIILPLLEPSAAGVAVSLAMVLGGEIQGRYLFFVSVVPKNMAASYLSAGKAAA
jgi:formate dehydrogenase iron-sulfur subunit